MGHSRPLEHENEREKKGKKDRNSNDGCVTVQWLLSAFFFFVEISKTTICLLCIVSNQNEERNIECWLEKYFTVNISFVKTYCRIYLGIILSALSFSDVQFCGRDDLMKFTRHFENHIGEG